MEKLVQRTPDKSKMSSWTTRSHDRKAMDFYPAWSVWRWHVPWSSKGNLEIPGRLTNVVDAMNKDVPGIWYTKMSKKWYNYPENED